ncbi:MAG: DUF6290 family protein [Elusimicrobia bacterium]|nr:DUF6290 family protein [Elusimicrobiota bacterium]
METKVKLIGVKMPVKLACLLEDIAEKQYKSVSTLIREMVVEYIEDELSLKSWDLIEKGRKEYREGKYTPWRKVLNG